MIKGISKNEAQLVRAMESRHTCRSNAVLTTADLPPVQVGRTPSQLSSTITQAVESQLVADVPVGVFLSGGIDSSLIATVAQRESTRPLRTFSIGFADPQFDESQFARRVAHRQQSHRADLLPSAICSARSTPRSIRSTSRWRIIPFCRRVSSRSSRPGA